MLVRVKGKGIKLSGKWCFKNQEAEIDETEYEKYKEYVDIIKEDDNTQEIPEIPNENDKDDEDIELQELRKKAKELGIKHAYAMKKENLEKAIAEKTAPLFGSKSIDNNTENPDETGKDDSNEVDKKDSDKENEAEK